MAMSIVLDLKTATWSSGQYSGFNQCIFDMGLAAATSHTGLHQYTGRDFRL